DDDHVRARLLRERRGKCVDEQRRLVGAQQKDRGVHPPRVTGRWPHLRSGAMQPGALTLKPMGVADLGLVKAWMLEPHVARWYLTGRRSMTSSRSFGRALRVSSPR